jgi:RIO kinase 1
VKERWKIEELVFDRPTLLTIAELMKKGMFDSLDYIISMGKEANVYRATKSDTFVAVKIYKVETAKFFKRHSYIVGDPRFKKIRDNERELVKLFALKEFKNLETAWKAGVPCPQPYHRLNNVVVMEFLGEGGIPYPKLLDVEVSEEDFWQILEGIRKMFKAGIVHADISEYNILKGDRDYFIDFGQGVSVKHPKAMEFLRRDLGNVVAFFKKRIGIERDVNEILKEWGIST